MAGAVVVGRGDLVATAVEGIGAGRSVLLMGGAGVGKSTVLSSVLADLPAAGFQVLSAAPAESDARLPFVTLIDLLRTVPDVLYIGLRPGSRRAVDAALLKQEVPERDVERLAVRLGVLELLRLVAATQPTVMAIDDLQWVDSESAEVLAFTARRLEGTPVVAVERVADGEQPRCRDLLPADALELLVPPLPADALAPALVQRSRGLIGPAVAARICALSAGNPLFALEIVDSLVRRGVRVSAGEPLPVPAQLDTLLRQRLGLLSESARETVRLAAAATRPTVTLLSRAGRPSAPADLSEAEGAGIASLSMDGRVHFEHPLLRAAIEGEAPAQVRMSLHARLAGVVTDPIEQARHLAFAVVVEDETVAEALARAAELARRRGAASTAFELAGLAAQRTPRVDAAGWAERKVAQAWYGYAAGLMDETQQVAREVLAADVPRTIRARAWVVLLESCGQAIGGAGEEIDAALVDAAGDPALEPWVRVHAAGHHLLNRRFDQALAEASWAADAAAAIGDANAQARALELILQTEDSVGAERDASLARAARLLRDHPDLSADADGLYIEQGRELLHTDQFVEARRVLEHAVRRAEEHGMLAEVFIPMQVLMWAEFALGNCEALMALASRSRQLSEDSDGTYWNWVLAALADAELVGGSLARAEEISVQAAKESERIGDVASLIIHRHLVGACHLATGDASAALAALQPAVAVARDEGITDRVRPALADLTEALARVGDLARARSVLDDLRTPTSKPPRRSVGAAVDRAEAIVLMMEGRSEEAAEMLAAVAAEQQVLSMPLEVARTLLAAAEVERRRRRRGAARSLLEQARQICLECKAKPLLERVEAELARLEPGRPGHQLTPMEERITAMVVAGSTNREIAEALAIGVTTVESSLSHIYRKLGLRSRVDLVRYRVGGP